MSVEWFDICTVRQVHRSMLLDPEITDESRWITEILKRAKLLYEQHGELVRIFGYLPKSYEQLDLQ